MNLVDLRSVLAEQAGQADLDTLDTSQLIKRGKARRMRRAAVIASAASIGVTALVALPMLLGHSGASTPSAITASPTSTALGPTTEPAPSQKACQRPFLVACIPINVPSAVEEGVKQALASHPGRIIGTPQWVKTNAFTVARYYHWKTAISADEPVYLIQMYGDFVCGSCQGPGPAPSFKYLVVAVVGESPTPSFYETSHQPTNLEVFGNPQPIK